MKVMPSVQNASNTSAPTQFLQASNETYAYRRLGSGPGLPLLFLQHFTGTLDNWDPAVTDPLASGREVILFESAGLGRSTGKVPDTVAGMATHALAFLDGLDLGSCDVLGFSLGSMVAQQMAQDRPSIFRRMILVGTAPRGGEDIMHLDKPSLAKYLGDPKLQGYAVLQKIFFAPTESSQEAGAAFICSPSPGALTYPPVTKPNPLLTTSQLGSNVLNLNRSRAERVFVEALTYFSAEKDVGVRIWLLMLATMGPSRSLSSRTLCQAGSFWNAVHRVSRSVSDSHGSI
jgi:pimeloyl-ACP methyl ester carboxylesterase